jgi:hypothetical protein
MCSVSSLQANPEDYHFFIFMNSSVRGPFVPPYARGATRWQDLFFNRLNDHIKLVGPTIRCVSAFVYSAAAAIPCVTAAP